MLTAIKALHTLIWAVLAGCILVLPWLAYRRRFRWAAILSAAIWVECAVIVLNRGRCPLTDWAARYTQDRAANFDIYLPLWIACYNKAIFGTLFFCGELLLLERWRRRKHDASFIPKH